VDGCRRRCLCVAVGHHHLDSGMLVLWPAEQVLVLDEYIWTLTLVCVQMYRCVCMDHLLLSFDSSLSRWYQDGKCIVRGLNLGERGGFKIQVRLDGTLYKPCQRQLLCIYYSVSHNQITLSMSYNHLTIIDHIHMVLSLSTVGLSLSDQGSGYAGPNAEVRTREQSHRFTFTIQLRPFNFVH
jgi:hypothetical protein